MDRLKEMLKKPAEPPKPGDPSLDELEGDFVEEDEELEEELEEEFDETEEDEEEAAAVGEPEGGITVSADSIEEGLEKASKQLKVSISELEYEIVQRGSHGFFGFGGKPYVFRIYPPEGVLPRPGEAPAAASAAGPGPDFAQVLKQITNTDGTFRLRFSRTGVWLKVSPPAGKGKPVMPDAVAMMLRERGVAEPPLQKIREVIARGENVPTRIAESRSDPAFDSTAVIEISTDEMHSFVRIQPPKPGGAALDEDDIIGLLTRMGVMEGISRESVTEVLENEIYQQPFEVATGIPPVNGEDSQIEFKFKVNKDEVTLAEDEKTGKIDYHNLNLVENVVVGQVLAAKIPATRGIFGKTVTGKQIPAASGKDLPWSLGKNVKLSEDGLKVTSEINGQVLLVRGNIQVEPIYEVQGDVGLQTGNIVFLGSVLVRGAVEDGFSIKAAGNIDVRGSCGKAKLEAEGDIFLRSGVAGKDEAEIIAGHDILAKFIEHARMVKAENDIIVNEGLLYSIVRAGKRVICAGKRGMIVAGDVMAGEEVNAKTIGSPSYAETHIQVGIDPKSREEMSQLEGERRVIKGGSNIEEPGKLKEINMNITTLTDQKRAARGKLIPEKEEMLITLTAQRDEMTARLTQIEERIAQIKGYLDALEERGKIAVQKTVFPKVRIMVRNAGLEVKDEFNYVTFVQEAGNIKILPYEESSGKDKSYRRGGRR